MQIVTQSRDYKRVLEGAGYDPSVPLPVFKKARQALKFPGHELILSMTIPSAAASIRGGARVISVPYSIAEMKEFEQGMQALRS